MADIIIETVPTEDQVIHKEKNYADYLLAVEEYPRMRVEYIEGTIMMTPASVPRHQYIVYKLLRLLGTYVDENDLGMLFPSPVDVELEPGARMVEPDVVFVASDRIESLVGPARITGAPDLVVEILSPSTARMDRTIKLPAYAASGIAEYWIVDVEIQSVEVYTLSGKTYIVAGVFTGENAIDVGRFADAHIAPADLFAAP